MTEQRFDNPMTYDTERPADVCNQCGEVFSVCPKCDEKVCRDCWQTYDYCVYCREDWT
jgi:hypothetical protein